MTFSRIAVGQEEYIIPFRADEADANGLPQLPFRVQVFNNDILTQNLEYSYYYPKPKYLIIGYMDP